jgi:MFS family permease
LLVPAGWLGDSIGYDRLVLAGAAVSIVGIAGCSVAPSWELFLAGRVVQGLGTALLYAGAPALLTTSVDTKDARAGAISWFQASSMIGLTIGPIIGGPLVEYFGWRAVYWIRIPIAVALAVLAFRARAPRPNRPKVTDVVSVAEAVRRTGFLRVNLVNSLANAAMFPTWLLVPTLLVDEVGVAVIAAGVVLAASPAMSAAGSLWVGRRLAIHDPTAMARGGLLAMAAGLALLAWTGPAGSIAAIVAGMAIVGTGLGVFSVPNMHVVMASLPLDRQGVAGGLSVMMRSLGVVIGALAASALFDPIEASRGFGSGFRIIFIVATALVLFAAFLTSSTD